MKYVKIEREHSIHNTVRERNNMILLRMFIAELSFEIVIQSISGLNFFLAMSTFIESCLKLGDEHFTY